MSLMIYTPEGLKKYAGTVEVDNALSSTSENPVSNAAVTQKMLEIQQSSVHVGDTEPIGKTNVWIDTSGEVPIFKYYNGTEWIVVSGGGSIDPNYTDDQILDHIDGILNGGGN